MNVQNIVRFALSSLGDKMAEAGVVPVAGGHPEFAYDEDASRFILAIDCVPRDQCQHEDGFMPVNVIEDGVVTSVAHCPICKRIV